MNIAPVSYLRANSSSYLKQSANRNATLNNFDIQQNLNNIEKWSLSFGFSRRALINKTREIKPVSGQTLDNINEMLQNYESMLPAMKKAAKNYNSICEDAAIKAKCLQNIIYENAIKPDKKHKIIFGYGNSGIYSYDNYGNCYYNQSIKGTEASYNQGEEFIFNFDKNRLFSYKQGMVNSKETSPCGYKEIEKGIINSCKDCTGEYFENRIYDNALLGEDANEAYTTRKQFRFNSSTDEILEYAENVRTDNRRNGFTYDIGERRISFDASGNEPVPLSYSENACHQYFDNFKTADRILTFKIDKNGDSIPQYYYENWSDNNGVQSYDLKAECLNDGSWVVIDRNIPAMSAKIRF